MQQGVLRSGRKWQRRGPVSLLSVVDAQSATLPGIPHSLEDQSHIAAHASIVSKTG